MAKATGSGKTSPLARRNRRSMEEVHAALARRSSGTLGVDLTRGLSRARSRQGNNAQGLLASSDDSGVLRVRTALSPRAARAAAAAAGSTDKARVAGRESMRGTNGTGARSGALQVRARSRTRDGTSPAAAARSSGYAGDATGGGGDGGVVRLPDAVACLVVEAVQAAQPTGGQALAMKLDALLQYMLSGQPLPPVPPELRQLLSSSTEC
mgnify:FL=1